MLTVNIFVYFGKDAHYLPSVYIRVLVVEEGVLFIPIQGSRSSGSSVWVTDDGSPLPYLPSTIDFEDNLSNTALVIFSRTDKYFFQAQDPTWRGYTAFACEIEK